MEVVGADVFTTLFLMFTGALVCGALPYFMRVRETHLQAVAALGAGLLIGSALAVIVPEGFHAFAEVRCVGGRCRRCSCRLLHHLRWLCGPRLQPLSTLIHMQATAHSHAHDHAGHDHDEHAEHEDHEEGLPEGIAGLVLVGGFLAMLLLDHLQHSFGGRCAAPGHHHHGHSHAHGASCSGSEQAKEAAAAAGSSKGKGKASGAAKEGSAAAATDAAVAAGEGEGEEAPADPTGKAKGAAGGACFVASCLGVPCGGGWVVVGARSPSCLLPSSCRSIPASSSAHSRHSGSSAFSDQPAQPLSH